MDHRIQRRAKAALLLASAIAFCAAQSASHEVQSQPECNPESDSNPCTVPTEQQRSTNLEGPYSIDPSSVENYKESTEEGDDDENDSGSLAVPIIGMAVVALVGLFAGGSDWVKPQELDADGPRFPTKQKLGRFKVQGYAAPGWPVAVILETVPGTRTRFELRYKGSDKLQVVDLSSPEQHSRMVVFNIPGHTGKLGVARYALRSAIVGNDNKLKYQPLKVHAIGAGPNAVGSLYLSVTDFSPARANGPGDVRWEVTAKRNFPRSRIEVLRAPKEEKGKYTLVNQHDIVLPMGSSVGGRWSSLPMKQKIGPGKYELQVRAWRTGAGGGDWTGAYSPNYVVIP